MRFSLEWLASYLPGEIPDAKHLATRLTSAGFISEGVSGEGKDAVLDIEITANRPDGMNHRGLAREAALALGRPFVDAESAMPVPETGDTAESFASVTIVEPDLCSRFSARVVTGIKMGPSSPDTQRRLAAIDASAISGPVDATNHVLWDVGQPLHAYDLDKLAKGSDGRPALVVRRARAGETLTTLDGVHRVLTPEHLVIADPEKPVGLAGVMGGLDTAISATTTRILLEAANFNAGVVRRTARSLGMHTDASHRFERGADPAGTVVGLDRAARMIVRDCGGSVARGRIDVVAREAERKSLTLTASRRKKVLGMDVSIARCAEILDALGFAPKPNAAHTEDLDVVVPTWRVDIEAEIDLIEEVIRSVGYDALPETLPVSLVPAPSHPVTAFEDHVRDLLAGFGLSEAVTYSFVSESENAPFASAAPGSPVTLENPLGEPFTTLRATPVIGLLKSAQHNVRHGLRDVALFEVGRSFGLSPEAGCVNEGRRAAILLSGARTAHWSEAPRGADFFDASGIVASLVAGVGAGSVAFSAAEIPFLAKGRAARIRVGGADAGFVGVVASDLARAYDLEDPVVADVDLTVLHAHVAPAPTSVEAPPRLPGSDVDLTVTHPLSRPYRELEAAIRSGAPAELSLVTAKSRYQGANVPQGFVKTTLHLGFSASERSLSREEINSWRDAAARRLLALGETKVDGVEG